MAVLKTEDIKAQIAKSDQRRPSESQVNVGATQVTSLYSGPIPPPEHLMMYERMVPGIAKQFLEEPHQEAEHRRNIETKIVDAQIKLANKGQNRGFILASVCVAASFLAIYLGYPLGGLGALFLSIGAFISVFMYGKSHKSNRS